MTSTGWLAPRVASRRAASRSCAGATRTTRRGPTTDGHQGETVVCTPGGDLAIWNADRWGEARWRAARHGADVTSNPVSSRNVVLQLRPPPVSVALYGTSLVVALV